MPRPAATPYTAVPDWDSYEYLTYNDFSKLAEERVELKRIEESVKERLAELNIEIGALMATAGSKSVAYGNYRFSLTNSTKGGTLSKERLLENGVTEAQILASTSPKVVGNSTVSCTMIERPPKGGGED